MLSPQGIVTFLLVPLSIIVCIIKTIYNGGEFPKFKYEIYINIKLMMARKVLDLPVNDCGYFAIAPWFQINYLVPLFHPLVKRFPGYGETFDSHSTWLVKNCDVENGADNSFEIDFNEMNEIWKRNELNRREIGRFDQRENDRSEYHSEVDQRESDTNGIDSRNNQVFDYDSQSSPWTQSVPIRKSDRYIRNDSDGNDQSERLLSESSSLSSPIIIYLHGGGYFIETSLPQLQAMLSIYTSLETQYQKSVSILHLNYKLTSKGYLMPYQLLQLYQTYCKLLESGYRNIILLGDSAGGNLAITFCQYLQQVKCAVFPKKLILVSPWVKIYPNPEQYQPGRSFYDNEGKDILNYQACTREEKLLHITGSLAKVGSLLISPGNLHLDRRYWQDIPVFNLPDYDIMILFGENEVYKDDIIDFIEYSLGIKIDGSANEYSFAYPNQPRVSVSIEPQGFHDSMFIIENTLNGGKHNYGITRVANFLNNCLN